MDIGIIKFFMKTGGIVGAVCLVLFFIVDKVFSEPVYTLLGSQKVFIILLVILGVLTTLIISYFSNIRSENNKIVMINYKKSNHHGDNRF